MLFDQKMIFDKKTSIISKICRHLPKKQQKKMKLKIYFSYF